ncbi:SDR family NAD(P)-dependent oxidoreductase [Sciscionella sediminilitoris]|uniref:SDR family NAD(P)-dependent oxidoreductase n=1 Tax=Sciscionella sediminilitoris TaxID=1445613 RepID=UPI0018D1CFD3|nr:SDR family NAD(P)-dependent oxidoreductase [Sciscionella sp. SE31]
MNCASRTGKAPAAPSTDDPVHRIPLPPLRGAHLARPQRPGHRRRVGIGLETARQLHAAGATVTLVDINADAVRKHASDLGDRARAYVADVTDESQVRAAIQAATAAFGPVHTAVNTTGGGTFGAIADIELKDWQRDIDLCLTSAFLGVKHEAQHMTEGGAIINIASLNARQPAEGLAAYCAAKAGVEMLTKVAAMELAPRGIRVNTIAPGLVDTPRMAQAMQTPFTDAVIGNTPLDRAGTPADMAAVVLFLASADSGWITGDTLRVDGGLHTKPYVSPHE